MSEPRTSFERAAALFIAAEKLGCDTPTEAMIAEAIQDAEFDTLHNLHVIAERHGGQRIPEIETLQKQIRQMSRQETKDIDACERLKQALTIIAHLPHDEKREAQVIAREAVQAAQKRK